MNGPDETQVLTLGGIEGCVKSETIPVNVCAPKDGPNDAMESVEDTSAVIEISDDGTWETKPASAEDLNNQEMGNDAIASDETNTAPGFLSSREECIVENVKIKHVTLAHSSQYYVNCPVASVKPMIHESLPNGTVSTEALDMKVTKSNEIITNDVATEVKSIKIECQSMNRVGMTNGGSATQKEVNEEAAEVIETESCASCQCVVPDEQILDGRSNVGSEEVVTECVSLPVATALDEDLAADTSIDPASGDVVTDSILQNKEKTKTYWEEMMMAAASGKESPNRFRTSDGRDHEDAEEAQAVFYDPEANGGEGTAWSLGGTCPKIVETVAKRIDAREETIESVGRESVIEREIRLQKEREEALQREREEARSIASPDPNRVEKNNSLEEWRASSPPDSIQRLETPAEVKIALELREMREREDELRKLRQQLAKEAAVQEAASEGGDAFHSIPTTDEGNYSECGGEEKDLGMEIVGSQMMSPDMTSLDIPSEHSCSFMHRRTQSTDSTSSGHSSGSGGPRAGPDYPPRRRIIVKPLADSEEDGDQSQYLRRSMHKVDDEMIQEMQHSSSTVRTVKETPIEREIRIAREREEELRREKGLVQRPNQTISVKPEVPLRTVSSPATHPAKGPQNVQLRLATNRIQREIQETTEREKELRDAGKIQTMSEDTVDSKVTRIGEISENDGTVLEHNKRMPKSFSTSQINVPEPSPPEVDGDVSTANATLSPTPTKSPSTFTLGRSISTSTGLGLIGNSNTTPSPRRFTPIAGQKGIMERFLASRGKLTCISPFSSSSSSSPTSGPTSPMNVNTLGKNISPTPAAKIIAPAPKNIAPAVKNIAPAVNHKPIAIAPVENQQVSVGTEPIENAAVAHRRGWMSAEEKIQEELKEMKMREDELRLQRAHVMAQSQPNLLSIMDDPEDDTQLNDDENKMQSLYSTLSNPNLLDLDGDVPVKEIEFSQDQAVQKNLRRKSALIAHWESRIQQNTDH